MNIALVRNIRIDIISVNSSYGKIEISTRRIQDDGGGNYTLKNSDIIAYYLSKKGNLRWVVNTNNTELAIYNGSRLIFNFSGEINSTSNEIVYDYLDLIADLITVYPLPSGGGGGSGVVETIVAGTNVAVDSSDPANPIVSASGGGSQTLAQTLVLGNTTGGENILVNDADAIELENTSLLKQGTYNFGGDGGISRICSVGFEDMWQSGIRHVFDNNGFIRNSTNCFTYVPDSSYDNTLRFKVGSLWTLDNGTTYVCNDASTGAAVWSLRIAPSAPYIEITQTDALILQNNQTFDLLTLGMTYKISLDDGSGFLLTEIYYDVDSLYRFKTSCQAVIYVLGNWTYTSQLTNCFVQTTQDLEIISLKSTRFDLNTDPIGILTQMVTADNTLQFFINVTIGRNCTITIDFGCYGMNGVTIGDNNTVTCGDKSKLLNISIDNGVDPIVFYDCNGQTNGVWSGHISKYDSDVNVIYPTLGFGVTDIDLTNYASFAGNVYTTATLGGNDISSISNGQDKRNYKIICAGIAGTTSVLNIGFFPTNIFANTYLSVGLPYLLSNNNFDNSDNVSIVFNGSNCLVKAVEIY